MGYSYTRSGALCCDGCNAAGRDSGVRKRPCPFGYCPSPALCSSCYANERTAGRHTKEAHDACRIASDEFNAILAHGERLRASGMAVRCAAMFAGRFPDGVKRVHVLFRRGDGTTIGRYMSDDTYNARPLEVPATPEDYARYGTVTDAPESFQ